MAMGDYGHGWGHVCGWQGECIANLFQLLVP